MSIIDVLDLEVDRQVENFQKKLFQAPSLYNYLKLVFIIKYVQQILKHVSSD